MADSDFKIENGVLIKYSGDGAEFDKSAFGKIKILVEK